jgi:histidinol-phosphate aminotransferase
MKILQQHGSLNHQLLNALKINPQIIQDFSVNINPYPVSPKVIEAIRNLDISSYPDPSVYQLKDLLALKNQVHPDQVLIGNGAAELIWLLAHKLWRRKKVLIVSPTFGEYERAARAVKASLFTWDAQPPFFIVDLDSINQTLKIKKPQIAILCNPNNPTGYRISDHEIHHLASANPDITFILDESYRAFVSESPFFPPLSENIIHLRSMTKDFALAGLRVGYLLADRQTVQELQSIQPPWSVNSVAQIAAMAAIEDLSYTQDTIRKLKNDTIDFKQNLLQIGANLTPSATHYFLINVSPYNAGLYWKKLLQRGFHVRDCTSFGCPEYIRISTRLPAQNAQFIQAWHLLNQELEK